MMHLCSKLLDAFLILLLAVLCGDMLYLYYAGGWHEPIRVIEIAEISSLYLFGMIALGRAILMLLRLFKEEI